MKRIFTVAVVVSLAQLAAPAVLACGGDSAGKTAAAPAGASTVVASNTDKAAPPQKTDAAPAEATFKMVSVDQVDGALVALKKDKKPVGIFDANSQTTREKSGIIPTAVLLPSSSEYDVALLPADKATPVVFYCANEKCTASHTAAKRALKNGHTDVAVLGAGIKGWVDAKKPVDKPVG
jgi:rhodanese-related sulfurtransferase